MTRQILIALMLLSPVTWANPIQNLESLSELKWKNRLILVEAGQQTQPYQDEFERLNAEIIERDIVWFIVNETEVVSNFKGNLGADITGELHQLLESHSRNVVLIGKDGGVKTTDAHLLLDEIFGEIDRMPMRQQELQSR